MPNYSFYIRGKSTPIATFRAHTKTLVRVYWETLDDSNGSGSTEFKAGYAQSGIWNLEDSGYKVLSVELV